MENCSIKAVLHFWHWYAETGEMIPSSGKRGRKKAADGNEKEDLTITMESWTTSRV
ncbi:MAG: hypothetical protein HFH15_01955 [Ruminococcus sp.]|nr:hypothetical protein [Ruminococcus sp.]